MSAPSRQPRRRPAAAHAGPPATGIPRALLVAGGGFDATLDAPAVLSAVARGLLGGGWPETDVCPVPEPAREGGQASARRAIADALDALDFDARMRASRAVVICDASLRERTLTGSVTFEIATRARQGGVPAYAVTREDRLDAFDARMLDLQAIVQATTARQLLAAGRRLAALV